MIRGLIALWLVVVAASAAILRSTAEIEAFRNFLESTRRSSIDDGTVYIPEPYLFANPEENSGKFDGDLVLDDFIIEAMVREYAVGRNAFMWPESKWPNNTVVWELGEYEFGPLQKIAIEEAIADIENHTCIKFRYRNPEDSAFVRVTGSSGGCYANVGYQHSRVVHTLNLARNDPGVGCFRHATIVHEWLHIIGFLHMQSTHNRDDYVKIIHENLLPGTEHNFRIYSSEQVSNLGVEYDYTSCLHYGPFAFTANGEPTIVPLKEYEGTMGQRLLVTDKDWLRVNRFYNCSGA